MSSPAPGPPLPMSRVRQGGGLVFVSGTVAVRDGEIVDGGIAAQVQQTIANLADALGSAGASLRDVLRCLCVVTDPALLPAFNEAYAAAFSGAWSAAGTDDGTDAPAWPTRTTLIAGLPHPDALVEIEAIAAIDPA